jgi:tRNA(Ile)-lysidine synthase
VPSLTTARSIDRVGRPVCALSAVEVFEAAAVLGAFERRLEPRAVAPIAVAFSGGGDSLAALLATKAWADRHGRAVLAINLDHRLQRQSAAWQGAAAEAAARVGASFRALAWNGPKPDHGLPASARAARHRLIAAAAREAGARVVVFGHTADDVLEAELMRSEGLRVGSPREWAPSPVWPEGRGLFLLRPLLTLRRAAIRQALRDAGHAWIDDPANEDQGSPRVRARLRIAGAGTFAENSPDDAGLANLARSVTTSPHGFLRIDRERLRRAPRTAGRKLLSAAVLSVGGGESPPRGERLGRLYDKALAAAPFQATLAGSRIVGAKDLLVVRDAGEIRRGGLAPLDLRCGEPVVWDGRFELTAARSGLGVRAIAGAIGRLEPAQHAALLGLPALARPATPALSGCGDRPVSPILASHTPVRIVSLAASRFWAACGAISKEPAT